MTLQVERSLTLLPLYASLLPAYDPFQYFLLHMEDRAAKITSPSFLSQCYMLRELDIVNLHMPFKCGDHCFTRGLVESIRVNPENQERIYHISFVPQADQDYPYHVSAGSDGQPRFHCSQHKDILFRHSIKECLLLKKGVLVYLKHLSAYFFRIITPHKQDYAAFDQFYFEAAFENLHSKIEKLQALQDGLGEGSDFVIPDSFQGIHELIQSEVNLDLLHLALQEGDHLPYLVSIKELEEQLYWHYNTMLLIYDVQLKAKAPLLQERLQKMTDEQSQKHVKAD